MKYNIGESLESIVEDMRKLTMLTGQLSSIHEETLYAWPLVLFDNVQNIEIKYDLTKDYTQEVGEGYIIYSIDISDDTKYTEEEFAKRGEILTGWVRDMFWHNIKVEIQTKTQGYTNSSKDKDNGLKQD
jgi:hypothetical protein